MSYSEPARTATRLLAAGLLAVAALAAALGYPPPPSPSTAASPTGAPRAERPRPQPPPRRAALEAAPLASTPHVEQPRPRLPPPQAAGEAAPPADMPRAERRGAPGEADGVVPDGTTVFDDGIPGVANLDPALLRALRRAATDAAGDGVVFFVNSGWRSPAYQSQLLREAVSRYGSEEEAAQWVAAADTSPHVSGDAVDIGPSDAAAWLSERGAEYGLCQIYGNEPWHYELRPEAIDRGCPPMYPDPTHDPRMREGGGGV